MAAKNVLEYIKKFVLSFRRNWGLKLVSLLFAVILWNYVITEQDPVRSVPYGGIPIVFDQSSITQLENSGYTVVGKLPERTVDVVINIPRNQFKNLNRDAIRAGVSLAGITSTGDKELKVSVYSPNGNVKSQSVSALKVTIERLVRREVPVDWKPEGDLPEGYWRGEPTFPTLLSNVLEVSGASSLVSRVERARIVINLDNLTERLSASREFELLDEDGNVLDPAGLRLEPPNCIVNLEVLPTKKVKIDASKSLNGSVAKGYRIEGAPEVLPAEIVIAGSQSILDTIDSIAPEKIDVNGITGDKSDTYKLMLPKGVIAVGENTVTVLVNVEENMTSFDLENQTVHVLNLASGLKVDSKQLRADITVTCPELVAPMVKESMIRLTVDATGLDARTHTLPIRAEYDPEKTGIKSLVIKPEAILVTITVIPPAAP